MLWTHFKSTPSQLRTRYMSPAAAEKLVLVSGQNVILAIANERLGIGEAHSLGLIHLYGTDEPDSSIS